MKRGSKISIVIRTCNEDRNLLKTLKHIEIQRIQPCEVIIVDSGSEDETINIARNWGAKIISIKKESFSYGRALNIGFFSCKGDILVSLSAHAIPQNENWLTELTKHFRKPNIVATSSRILPRGSIEAFLLSSHFLFLKHSIRNHPSLLWNTSSAFLKETWEIFPFNEYLTSGEDMEWGLRVRSLGYDIIYEPKSVVLHYHKESLWKFFPRAKNSQRTKIEIYARYFQLNKFIGG